MHLCEPRMCMMKKRFLMNSKHYSSFWTIHLNAQACSYWLKYIKWQQHVKVKTINFLCSLGYKLKVVVASLNHYLVTSLSVAYLSFTSRKFHLTFFPDLPKSGSDNFFLLTNLSLLSFLKRREDFLAKFQYFTD